MPDEKLHAWECGYNKFTGLWDDGLAAEALRRRRTEFEAAKAAAREAKAAARRQATAARAAEKRRGAPANQGARKAPRNAAPATAAAPPAATGAGVGQKRSASAVAGGQAVRRCTECQGFGHQRNSKKCPKYTAKP